MASLKNNIILNGLNTVTGILFPIITFPYAARVLMPEGIGTINFLNSIINYIILFTSLGIPIYAVKEIAKYRDDKDLRDQATVEIIILSVLLSAIGYVAVILLSIFIPKIHADASLFYILSISILLTSIGVNWFYQGIEDFKFITIRAIIIRILSASALFIFVKNSSDLIIYGIITVGSTVGNNFINFIHLRHHINLKKIIYSNINIFKHIKQSLYLFTFTLITSLYVQLNTVMLGFISNDEEVGFFTAGTKISHVALILITSISTVLLPRCSNLIKNNNIEGFKNVSHKSINLTLGLSIPICVGLLILADPITTLFCGPQYLPSIPVLYFNAPVIIIIGLTNLLGLQILYPLDKINIVIWSVSFAAITNLIFNFLLISRMGATGAAISTLIAECVVLIIQLYKGKAHFPFKLSYLFKPDYLIASLIMGIAIYLSTFSLTSSLLKIVVGFLVGIMIYSLILIILKNKLIEDLLIQIQKLKF